MGYIEALRAAGAEVICYQHFGDYQGSIWTKIRYQGEVGWVRIHYGSCSYCDNWQRFACEDYHFDDIPEEKVAEFGRSYLDHIMPQEEAETAASENLDWDLEAGEVLDFIKDNA